MTSFVKTEPAVGRGSHPPETGRSALSSRDLQESVAIEILAGDYRTPKRLHVDAVTPPSVDTIIADCDYPQYTGWNTTMETSVPVRGSELSLPVGTAFDLIVASNKPLQSATLSSELFEITGDRSDTRLASTDSRFTLNHSGPMIADDGKNYSSAIAHRRGWE